MVIINLSNINGINTSLQVGDAIFAIPTGTQSGAKDAESMDNNNNSISVGVQNLVGTLSKVEFNTTANTIQLFVDQTFSNYVPNSSDYIMFSKHNQKNGDVSGYYARAKFVNDSKEKAELFAVSSEVVINSK